MSERADIVVIGGGQSGLAMSYYLRRIGREHLVVERKRIAERWRSERWDSLMFQFPNWSIKLPGYELATENPEGFTPGGEIVRFIETYASLIEAPVRSGMNVTSLRQSGSQRFEIETDRGVLDAACVVVATGPYQLPIIPSFGRALADQVVQIHTRDYRNPGHLPAGAVLVVGSGASGIQIAEELHEAGREVYLSVGRHQRTPRRYCARDVYWWLDALGILKQPTDQRSSGDRFRPHVTGVGGGREINLRRFANNGMILLGRLQGVADNELYFSNDLEERLAEGDAWFSRLQDLMEARAREIGMDSPNEKFDEVPPAIRRDSPEKLDLKSAGITSVLWATGYGYDFNWIRIPVFDDRFQPVHRRGVTQCPGLYFLGLRDMYTMSSSHLSGVGDDAAYLAEHISANS